MGKQSKIEWTDHTFNIAWGCTKVSPACKNCYAEAFSKRIGLKVWGAEAGRRVFGPKHWAEPIKWNAAAQAAGRQERVFCSSMADVFEDHTALETERAKLWPLIHATPSLTWLLLTKRPENVRRMAPYGQDWPRNVWLGATAEDQGFADDRIIHLAENPAKVRFLSCEPLLGPIRLGHWLGSKMAGLHPAIHWVIVGGESGHHARPMREEWASYIRDQCANAGVPFFFKQWGEIDENGSRSGKKMAGRSLHGKQYNELPAGA